MLTLQDVAADAAGARAVPPPSRIEAVRVAEEDRIQVDGRLDEAVWQMAQAVTDFRQRDPDEGAGPSLPTRVQVAFDETALFVAVRASDPQSDQLVGILTRRDTESPSDWLRVVIDAFHDRRTAYEFAVNAAGVQLDKFWFDDTSEDLGWDARWDVAVVTDATGWQAEFRLPFAELRVTPGDDGLFGFGVVRQIGRLNETVTWPLLAKSARGYVSSLGELSGLDVAGARQRLALVPYTVIQATTDAEPASPNQKPSGSVAGGLDLRYGLTPGLTLTGTINPDFGQVEADPAVVNLTAFETFFAERRPFFVEGTGILRFDLDCNDGQCTGLFYTRRVGRPPQVDVEAPAGAAVEAPAQTTILGAAKLTGRVGNVSLGMLQAVTGAEHARVLDAGVPVTRAPAEPRTSYSIGRFRREFGDQSTLGGMVTATRRQITPELETLADTALTGGVDWDWRLGSLYSLTGYWAGSHVTGSEAALTALQEDNRHSFQRSGATHVSLDRARTSLGGHAGSLALGKRGGEVVRFNSAVKFKTPGFDVNDLGFLRRADERWLSNWIQFRRDRPWRAFRNTNINFNQWMVWNFGGDRISNGGNVNGSVTLTSNWRLGAGIGFNGAVFDDRLTRGGPGGLTTTRHNLWTWMESDDRRAVRLNLSSSLMRDRHRSSEVRVEPQVTLRPTPAWAVTLGVRYTRTIADTQWIENVTDAGHERFVFGHLDQKTAAITARVNYTVTPTLSVQLYAEPFVSAGDYTDFKALADGRAPRYADRYAPLSYDGNPDFTTQSFRTTNVLRWEYRPGSTVFLVWQQRREAEIEGRPRFRVPASLGEVFGVAASNVVLVKVAHWFDF